MTDPIKKLLTPEIEAGPPTTPGQTVEFETMKLEENTASFFADLEKIRLSPNDAGDVGTTELLSLVPVRKPRRGEFFMASNDPRMCLAVAIYQDPVESDEVFFVAPNMRGLMAEDLKAVLLQLCISLRGTVFIWPLTLAKEDNARGRSWHESARKAAEAAKTSRVRILPDRDLNGYRIRKAEGNLPKPEWPTLTFNQLLDIAFSHDRIISGPDHIVMQRLRGLK
jgi:hypothetical protein